MSDNESNPDSGEQNRGNPGYPAHALAGDGGSDIDRFFKALADERRRRTLIYLQQHESVSLEDLATFLAQQEGIDPDSEAFQRLHVELAHLHLPKLADHGLLSFDERSKMVGHESLPTAVEDILALAAGLEEMDGTDDSHG